MIREITCKDLESVDHIPLPVTTSGLALEGFILLAPSSVHSVWDKEIIREVLSAIQTPEKYLAEKFESFGLFLHRKAFQEDQVNKIFTYVKFIQSWVVNCLWSQEKLKVDETQPADGYLLEYLFFFMNLLILNTMTPVDLLEIQFDQMTREE